MQKMSRGPEKKMKKILTSYLNKKRAVLGDPLKFLPLDFTDLLPAYYC